MGICDYLGIIFILAELWLSLKFLIFPLLKFYFDHVIITHCCKISRVTIKSQIFCGLKEIELKTTKTRFCEHNSICDRLCHIQAYGLFWNIHNNGCKYLVHMFELTNGNNQIFTCHFTLVFAFKSIHCTRIKQLSFQCHFWSFLTQCWLCLVSFDVGHGGWVGRWCFK